ncbi:hypothetical protein [Alcanivorax sp.]|uniref:hypothetical protein n=1 Tax=Alcanivorax sp. TaxID=1872427 RepID=UPI0025BE5EA5|nr:hypothetical protein [Alcanivorax sp.]
MKLNVLTISIACPPKKDSESLQVAKYLKYLSMSNRVDVDVVTSKNPTLYMPYDSSLEHYLDGVRQLVQMPIKEWRYTNILLRRFCPSLLVRPDSKFSFVNSYARVSVLLRQCPDVIYSRSYPLSSTVMAYRLQQQLKRPWVLHLSDPWTINPLNSLAPCESWNESMERRCFAAAKILSFTSNKTLKRYSERYPEFAYKMKVFPNVFDPDDLRSTVWRKEKKLKCVYTGGLVGTRTPKILVDALMLLKECKREVFDSLEVVLAGETDRGVRNILNDQEVGIKHIGVLNFDEAISLQASADLLLLIDTPTNSSDEAMFFPSKLLDYMLAGRRVVAITDSHSSTAQVVKDSSLGDVIEHDDHRALMETFVCAFENWRGKQSDYFFHQSLDQTYSAMNQADRLVDLFHDVCEER